MHLFTGIIVIISIWGLAVAAPSISITSTSIITGTGTYAGYPAAVLNEVCNISVIARITGPIVHYNVSNSQIKLEIKFPFTSLQPGICTQTNAFHDNYCTPIFDRYGTSYSAHITASGAELPVYWKFNDTNQAGMIISRHGFNLTSLNETDVTFTVLVRVKNSNPNIGKITDVMFTAHINDSIGASTSSSNATLRIIGPAVTVNSNLYKTDVDVGSSFNVNFTVEHLSTSTENISNIQISVKSYVTGMTSSVLVSGSYTPLPYSTNATHLYIGERININTRILITDAAEIGQPLYLRFIIRYKSMNDSSPDYTYDRLVSIGTMRDIQSVALVMNFPSILTPKSNVSVKVNFDIPKGVLPSLTFFIESESSLYPLKAVIFYSHVSIGEHLRVSGGRLQYSSRYDRSPRLRRSVVRSISNRPYITIAHPASSPSTFAPVGINGIIDTSGVGLSSPSISSGGPMNIKVGIKYGSKRRVLRSVVATVAAQQVFIQKTSTQTGTDGNSHPLFSIDILIYTLTSASGPVYGYLEDDIHGIGLSSLVVNGSTTGRRNSSVTSTHLYVNFTLPVGGTFSVSYKGNIIKESFFTDGVNNRTALVFYNFNSAGISTTYAYQASTSACIYRENKKEKSYYGLFGYIPLLLFVGILVGFVLLILVGVLYIKVINKDVNPFDYDNVQNTEDRMAMLETQDRLLMDESGTNSEFNTIKNLSTVNNTDSIVQTLVNKNRHQLYRDLDSLDILNSIYIDQGLESDYERLSSEALTMLVSNLARHGTLKGELVDKSVQKFQKNIQTMEKEVQTQHKKEANKIMKELSKKNKLLLQQLLSKHRKEKEALENDVAGEDEKVQKEILDLQAKQHRAERDDLVHKLKLQQDEESEKLRKRFSLQKRAMLRDLERNLLDDIIAKNALNPSQADWILSEHRRVQSHLDQRYNDELARQRMMLEEKLERRRALAKKKELEEENQTEMLNILASQQVNIVKRLRREEDITPEQADEYMTKIKDDMMRAKESLDKEKDQQERLLREKLNSRKKKQMEVKDVNYKMEEAQLQRELKEASSQAMVDPTVYIDALMDLHAKQRMDVTQSENDIDEEDTKELLDQYQFSVAQTEANIRLTKDQLLQQLQQDGVSEDELSKICQQHNRELRQLQEAHDEERQVQEQNLKARLLARRKEMESSLAQEKQEQEDLRRHENTMVQNLLMNQVSISDEERDRILKEHEKNMVQVENSLTLSRLRQKRMLEEALAERKAKQMEKLQKKQTDEAAKKLQLVNDSDDEDERSHRDLIEMMKRHSEQRLELLRGDDMDIDDEVENVRNKMMEERANALKDQEERIASMLSSLQIAKAKELSRIEEQQKAINNLKMNLMDDLSERGVLSDSKCQQIIHRHQDEQTRLIQRLDDQRDEQEQMLRERLRKRMDQKEQQMNSEQKRQLEESVQELPVRQRAQAQIRKALLLHKQMLETEQFKNRLTKESNQTLEDAKRQFDVKKEKYLQDQELNFIAGLVQLGKFSKAELLAVLKILFPLKNSSEIEAILNKIHSGKDEKPALSSKDDTEPSDLLAQSTLVDRTKVSFQGVGSIARFKLKSPKKKQAKGNLMSLNMGGNSSGLTPIDRPDPLGRDSPNVIPDVPSGRGGDLPPLEPLQSKKKKKRKKKRTTQVDEDDDEDDDQYLRVRA